MVNHIITSENRSEEGTFAYYYEDYLLHSDICKQHRNKVACQASLIKEAIASKWDTKVLSIGCGTSADMEMCIDEIERSACGITLVDIDKDAIVFSLQQLQQIKERITPLQGNIYKLLCNLSEHYDLILIGGVFDYLNDKTIIAILQSLRNNLTENGKIFFTNIDKNNPYRVFMEYTSDWILIERSEDDLISLIVNAGWPMESYQIIKDETGLTHMVELNKTSFSAKSLPLRQCLKARTLRGRESYILR